MFLCRNKDKTLQNPLQKTLDYLVELITTKYLIRNLKSISQNLKEDRYFYV